MQLSSPQQTILKIPKPQGLYITPKLKPVVVKPLNAEAHPALTVKRSIKNLSSVVGPTIKPGSRLDAYLPEISQRHAEIKIYENEPLLRSLNQAMDDGDAQDIDGIKFWTGSEHSASITELAKRRLSLSMAAHQHSRQDPPNESVARGSVMSTVQSQSKQSMKETI